MSDQLKLSDALGATEASGIASAIELNDDQKRIRQLEENVAALKKNLTDRSRTDSAVVVHSNNKIGARKHVSFKAIGTAPSINKTPIGPTMVPIPYPTVQDLSTSVAAAKTVNFNGSPAYLFDDTTQPHSTGDEPGTGKGVKSGTVSGEVRPVKGSSTVRIEGKQVVREGDPCTMNGGNNPGTYVTTPDTSGATPKNALATSNPPITLETSKEKTEFEKWLDHMRDAVSEAIKHPLEGLKGAGKGIANIPSDMWELILKVNEEQRATDLQEAAITASVLGQHDTAKTLSEVSAETSKQAKKIDVPKFEMKNLAQEGGDAIATIIQLFAGGVGIIKSAEKATTTIGKVSLVEGGANTSVGASKDITTTAGSATGNDGVHVIGTSDNIATAKRIAAARVRQQKMLDDDIGYNISPTSWDNYGTIGRNGTFISDKELIHKFFGELNEGENILISSNSASEIENDMDLFPGTLKDGFKVRKITNIKTSGANSPLEGNQYFLGPGNHLPGGAPEMVIDSISTTDNGNVKTIAIVKVK